MEMNYEIDVHFPEIGHLNDGELENDIEGLQQYGLDAVNALGGNTDIARAIEEGMVEVNFKNIKNSLESLADMNANFTTINSIYSDAHDKILARIRSGADGASE